MEEKNPSSNLSNYYFLIEFPTCNSFRQVLEFLNQTHSDKTIPLIFKKNCFSIRKPNDSQTVLFESNIYSYNLTKYYVDPEELEKKRLELEELKLKNPGEYSENLEPEFYIHIPLAHLLVNLKKSQKKQKIRIYQKKDKDNKIIISTNESGTMSSEIIIDPSKEVPFSFSQDSCSKDPNITIQLSGFYYSSTGGGRMSERQSIMEIYDKGFKIFSSSSHGDTNNIEEGICTDEPISKIKISENILKSISKLASLSDEGIIRVYCSCPEYVKLEVPISVIGTANIYLLRS